MFQDPEFWFAVAVVILIVAIYRPAKKSMTGGLDARADRIKSELDEARQLREEAQALLDQYRRKQRDAMKEAEAIVKHAAEEAERGRSKAVADLEASLKRREQQAIDRIAQAEAKAVAEVRALAVDLAIAVTHKLLADHLDPGRSAALVDQAIAELPQRLH